MPNRPGDDPPLSFSRRAFLKSASVVAAGGAVASSANASDRGGAGATVYGRERHDLELTINGASNKVKVETRTTLLETLRDHLDLTGTKEICDRGACGGCTVLIDGLPVNSCMTLAFDAVGTEITTIEGIGSPKALHPVQRAFVECDALQCGFCTPGMVVSAVACIDRHGRPTRDQIKADMSGNLCRCGTYPRVFEAIEKASGQEGRK